MSNEDIFKIIYPNQEIKLTDITYKRKVMSKYIEDEFNRNGISVSRYKKKNTAISSIYSIYEMKKIM